MAAADGRQFRRTRSRASGFQGGGAGPPAASRIRAAPREATRLRHSSMRWATSGAISAGERLGSPQYSGLSTASVTTDWAKVSGTPVTWNGIRLLMEKDLGRKTGRGQGSSNVGASRAGLGRARRQGRRQLAGVVGGRYSFMGPTRRSGARTPDNARLLAAGASKPKCTPPKMSLSASNAGSASSSPRQTLSGGKGRPAGRIRRRAPGRRGRRGVPAGTPRSFSVSRARATPVS
jgi:hypothetical protein